MSSEHQIIRVFNLSKKYRIGEQQNYSYYTLRETLERKIVGMIKKTYKSSINENFWALKEISFSVDQGEVLGIIGHNGAGKSTLLKILSQITAPTEGTIELKGRIGSLLEVGTGFHPEMTGRENIYLNGSILGMKKAEIEEKFDEIVKFSEIEKFLDTPVKRYSSGMYVRLAFAVAAHLEPEILLVDEVLAVGDAQFQKKCLGKMGEVAKEGRTVLFVSHSMAAISKLCSRCLLLDSGKIIKDGPCNDVINSYFNKNAIFKGKITWDLNANPPTDGETIIVNEISLLNKDGITTSVVYTENPFWIEIEYEILKPIDNCWLGFSINLPDKDVLFFTGDFNHSNKSGSVRKPGRYKSICKIPENLLNHGMYSISLLCQLPGIKLLFYEESLLNFEVTTLTGLIGFGKQPGILRPILNWKTTKIGDVI